MLPVRFFVVCSQGADQNHIDDHDHHDGGHAGGDAVAVGNTADHGGHQNGTHTGKSQHTVEDKRDVTVEQLLLFDGVSP